MTSVDIRSISLLWNKHIVLEPGIYLLLFVYLFYLAQCHWYRKGLWYSFYRQSRQSSFLQSMSQRWSYHSSGGNHKCIAYETVKYFWFSFLIGRKMIYSLITYQVLQSVLICSNKSTTSGRAAGMSYYSVKFMPVHCNQSWSIWFL